MSRASGTQVSVQAVVDGPSVKWGHIDGPMLTWAGNAHWLTWRERLRVFLHLASVDQIGCERFPWLAKQRIKLIITAHAADVDARRTTA